MFEESIIYDIMTNWLEQRDWVILGGQPPGGTESRFPIIEIKDHKNKQKGSKGSKRIDIIAYKYKYFLLLELKSKYDSKDIEKLNEITNNNLKRHAFIQALIEKQILKNQNIFISIDDYINQSSLYIKAVAFNDVGKTGPDDFITFLISENKQVNISSNNNIIKKLPGQLFPKN